MSCIWEELYKNVLIASNFFPIVCWELSGLKTASLAEDYIYKKVLSSWFFYCNDVFIMLSLVLSLIKLEKFCQDDCLHFLLAKILFKTEILSPKRHELG